MCIFASLIVINCYFCKQKLPCLPSMLTLESFSSSTPMITSPFISTPFLVSMKPSSTCFSQRVNSKGLKHAINQERSRYLNQRWFKRESSLKSMLTESLKSGISFLCLKRI